MLMEVPAKPDVSHLPTAAKLAALREYQRMVRTVAPSTVALKERPAGLANVYPLENPVVVAQPLAILRHPTAAPASAASDEATTYGSACATSAVRPLTSSARDLPAGLLSSKRVSDYDWLGGRPLLQSLASPRLPCQAEWLYDTSGDAHRRCRNRNVALAQRQERQANAEISLAAEHAAGAKQSVAGMATPTDATGAAQLVRNSCMESAGSSNPVAPLSYGLTKLQASAVKRAWHAELKGSAVPSTSTAAAAPPSVAGMSSALRQMRFSSPRTLGARAAAPHEAAEYSARRALSRSSAPCAR